MRRLALLLFGCAMLCLTLSTTASADLLFYDAFNYPSGEKLAPRNDTTTTPNPGQHNVAYNVDWRYAGGGLSTNEAPGITGGSLSVPGLQPSTGNSVAFDTTQIGSARIQVTSSPINSGTVYWSGLLRLNDVGALTTATNGMLLGGFNNTVGPGGLPTAVGAVLRIRKDGSDPNVNNRYFIGTAMNSGTGAGNVQFATGAPQFAGDTVFVVASYTFVAGSNNDIARMWIDPNAADFGAAMEPSPTLTSAPGGTIADSFPSLSTFNLRNVNTVGNPNLQFDELRVGTTWADVTPLAVIPEPSPFFVLLLASALLIAARVKLWKLLGTYA